MPVGSGAVKLEEVTELAERSGLWDIVRLMRRRRMCSEAACRACWIDYGKAELLAATASQYDGTERLVVERG